MRPNINSPTSTTLSENVSLRSMRKKYELTDTLVLQLDFGNDVA